MYRNKVNFFQSFLSSRAVLNDLILMKLYVYFNLSSYGVFKEKRNCFLVSQKW